jgi:hypothetical protein
MLIYEGRRADPVFELVHRVEVAVLGRVNNHVIIIIIIIIVVATAFALAEVSASLLFIGGGLTIGPLSDQYFYY